MLDQVDLIIHGARDTATSPRPEHGTNVNRRNLLP